MENVKDSLQIAVWIVQLLGFALASLSAYLAYRSYSTSRDVQVALNLSESFRSHWEGAWRQALKAVAEPEAANRRSDPGYKEQLTNMLNWIDWVGMLMEAGLLPKDKDVALLRSIRAPLVRIIEVNRTRIAADMKKDPNFWSGVETVAERLGIELTDSVPDAAGNHEQPGS